MLPSILSNFDIDKVFENVEGYNGCTSKDLLTKWKLPKNKVSFGVINLQDSDEGQGSHWVCYFNDPNEKYACYFDSFGIIADPTILKFLRKSKKEILYSTTQLQSIASSACGYYCIYFILERLKGTSYYDIIYQLDTNGRNEKFIQKFRKNLSKKLKSNSIV